MTELTAKYADEKLVKRLQFELDRNAFVKTENFSVLKSTSQDETELPPAAPENKSLFSNHPNPFNPETRIQYQISEASLIQLRIYNLMGQEIRTLVQEQQNPGTYSVVWDGKNDSGIEVSSGVYIYQVTVQPNSPDSRPFQKNGKMLLVR